LQEMNLRTIFLDLFFPRFCVECGAEGGYVCAECMLFISEAEPVCPICGWEEYAGKRHATCPSRNRPEGLVSFFDHEGPIKRMLHATREDSLIEIPEELVLRGMKFLMENPERYSEFLRFLLEERTEISYVPRYKKEVRKRGFDEARVASRALACSCKKRESTLLEREGDGFRVRGRAEQVVLLEDLWIDGERAKECVETLKRNGTRYVWVLALARAIP